MKDITRYHTMKQAPIQSQLKRFKGIQSGGQRNKTSRRHRGDVVVAQTWMTIQQHNLILNLVVRQIRYNTIILL